jgi:hypothetical protein
MNKNELKQFIGKPVKIKDLENIYDLWIILTRPKDVELAPDEGILSFVGKETNEESDKLYTKDNVIIPIYHSSNELSQDTFYEG